jgi:hypothetical protein
MQRAVPVPPKDFDDSVASSVMCHGSSEGCFRYVSQSLEEFGHELWSFVAMQYIRWAVQEHDLIQKRLDKGFIMFGRSMTGYKPWSYR